MSSIHRLADQPVLLGRTSSLLSQTASNSLAVGSDGHRTFAGICSDAHHDADSRKTQNTAHRQNHPAMNTRKTLAPPCHERTSCRSAMILAKKLTRVPRAAS